MAEQVTPSRALRRLLAHAGLAWAALVGACAPDPEPAEDDSDPPAAHTDAGDSDPEDSDEPTPPEDTEPLADTEPPADTEPRRDSDAHTDDPSVDTDPEPVDTGTYTGVCAPPDRWTGPVPPGSYTRAPYPVSYDVGMKALLPTLPRSDGSSSSNFGDLVVGATVAAVYDDGWSTVLHLADGLVTVPTPVERTADVRPGDQVVVGIFGWEIRSGSVSFETRRSTVWVQRRDQPVAVRERGAAPLTYGADLARLTHLYGEITGPSEADCGGAGYRCFVVDHGGTHDLIRVPVANDFGLDADYAGGLCAELVAPVDQRAREGGTAVFLDVADPSFLRVWPKP